MKKIVFVVLAVLAMSVIWIIEPVSYNPFGKLPPPLNKSVGDYTCLSGDPTNGSQVTNNVNTLVDNAISSNKFLGVSTGILREGCGSYVVASGYSSKRDATAFTPETINRVASISKPMTAIAIMQLVEKGLIDLDAPIQNYLTNYPKQAQTAITVRHLLNHTSGIAHYSSKLDALSFSHYATLNDAIEEILNRDVIAQPGKRYQYSSFGYTVLGAIVERVSKLSFEQYLRLNIWDKAGMQHTSLERSFEQQINGQPNKSRLYLKINSTYVRAPYNDLSIISPAGGVQSNLGDLLKFGQAVLNNNLISRESLLQMIDVQDSMAPAFGDDAYGLGWNVYNHDKYGRIIAHSGAQPGASTYLRIYLDKGVVSATLSNAFGTKSSSYELTNNVARLVL